MHVILITIYVGVNALLSVDGSEVTEDSAILICKLPCFSPILKCVISQFKTNNMDVDVTNITSDVIGSVMAYSYPTRTMILVGLDSGTTYKYCVVATDANDMETGKPVCSNFTTRNVISDSSDGM